MSRSWPTLALAVLAAVALPSLATVRAQSPCTPVAGTGCPGSSGPQCSGSNSIGQAFKFACLNNGRADAQFLIVGNCLSQPFPFQPPVTCVPGPCGLAVNFAAALLIVPTNFNTILVQIPNDPTLIGKSICMQCADVITPKLCLTLSEAVSVTFAP